MKRGILFFGLFVLAFVYIIPIVSADFFSIIMGDWRLTEQDMVYVKYAFAVIIAIVLYLIMHYTKIPDKPVYRIVFALIIAFLATFFISPQEIYTVLMANYFFVLAVVLAIIIWFIIMIFLTVTGKAKWGRPY